MQLKETRKELSVLVIRQFFLTVNSKRSDKLLYDCAIRILSMVCSLFDMTQKMNLVDIHAAVFQFSSSVVLFNMITSHYTYTYRYITDINTLTMVIRQLD